MSPSLRASRFACVQACARPGMRTSTLCPSSRTTRPGIDAGEFDSGAGAGAATANAGPGAAVAAATVSKRL